MLRSGPSRQTMPCNGPIPAGVTHRGWTARVAERPSAGIGETAIFFSSYKRSYVDEFERVIVGWHGSYDPPGGM